MELYERAKGYYSLSMLSEAYQDLKLATSINPYFEKAQLLKIKTLWDLDRPDELLEVVDNVLKLNPESAQAYLFSGKARFAKGHLPKAIFDFNKALYLDSECKEAYLQLGSCYVAQGKLHKACAMFQEAEENGNTVSFSDLCQ